MHKGKLLWLSVILLAIPGRSWAEPTAAQLVAFCGKGAETAEYQICIAFIEGYVASQQWSTQRAASIAEDAARVGGCGEEFDKALRKAWPVRKELSETTLKKKELNRRGTLDLWQITMAPWHRFCIPQGVSFAEVAAAFRSFCLDISGGCSKVFPAAPSLETALQRLYPCYEKKTRYGQVQGERTAPTFLVRYLPEKADLLKANPSIEKWRNAR